MGISRQARPVDDYQRDSGRLGCHNRILCLCQRVWCSVNRLYCRCIGHVCPPLLRRPRNRRSGGATSVHLANGIWGTLALGLFSQGDAMGLPLPPRLACCLAAAASSCCAKRSEPLQWVVLGWPRALSCGMPSASWLMASASRLTRKFGAWILANMAWKPTAISPPIRSNNVPIRCQTSRRNLLGWLHTIYVYQSIQSDPRRSVVIEGVKTIPDVF